LSKASSDLVKELRIAIRTGQVVIGSRRTVKMVLLGKAKLVVIASNAPPELREDIYRYAKLSNIKVIEAPLTNTELGAAIGKPFSVASLAIIDPGESNILNVYVEG